MTQDWTILFCALAILLGGIVSGIFFAFSDFIMKSLATIPHTAVVDAMAEINRRVYRSIFIIGIWGVALLSAALIYAGAIYTQAPESPWLIAGGIIAVSFMFNIPMNHKLESLGSTHAKSQSYWQLYLPKWTRWNHVRSGSAIVSTACFLMALINMKLV